VVFFFTKTAFGRKVQRTGIIPGIIRSIVSDTKLCFLSFSSKFKMIRVYLKPRNPACLKPFIFHGTD